ncbi:MAG: SRPBCC domain-containing protein [bacterium]|jgi:hypothetical protein
MHEIVTHIDLPASAARVWAALTDFASYHAWNPVIESIDGTPVEGARLRLSLRDGALRQRSNGPAHAIKSFAFRAWCALNGMRMTVHVTKLLPERELRWLGTLPLPKMFEGEHYFRISERREGGVRLTQGERYAGLLVPAFREAVESINGEAMNSVNRALRHHLEGAC